MRKLAIAFALFALWPGIARASEATTVGWTGNGSENTPCSNGAHWVLSPAKGVSQDAPVVLTVDGSAYLMVQNGNGGSFAVDSAGTVSSSSVVTASFVPSSSSTPNPPFLKLSHCLDGGPSESPSPTETPSPSPSESPSDSPTPSVSPTGSDTPKPSTSGIKPSLDSPRPSDPPRESPTALTGARVGDRAAIAVGLLGLGLGLTYLARRRQA